MNQNIYAQLQADQDNWNSHQSRFNNELLNFDMDKRSQQLTQQATNFATAQARKASGALSNQLFGQDITQSAVEAAPLLYKGGRYLKQRGLRGAAEDLGDAATELAGRVRARVQDLAPEVPKVEDPLAGVGGQLNPGQRGDATLARATAEENVRGGLPDIESLRGGQPATALRPEAVQPLEGQRGILGMGGDRYRYDTASGTIRDTETGRQPDFSFPEEPRSTIFSRDADVDTFRSDPATRARFDEILGVQEREQLQGQPIPEFQAPVQPPRQVSQLPAEARDPASVAQRVDYNPSVQSEVPPARPAPARAARPAPAPEEAATSGAKIGEDVEEGAKIGEDVAEDADPEVAVAAEGVDLLAETKIPVVSTIAKGIEDVGDDIAEGFEDLFGGSKKADPLPTRAPPPEAPALRDSLSPMRDMMGGTTGDFEKDFPAPPSGDTAELQSRLDVLRRESGAPITDEELQDRATASARKVAPPTAEAEKAATEDRAELPGAGETLMGATALAGLGVAAEEHSSQDLGGGSLPMPTAPAAPRAPGLAFEAAPTIDSTNYHNF